MALNKTQSLADIADANQRPLPETTGDMSELSLTIMMTAVRIARNKQIHKGSVLRQELKEVFPGKEPEIERALVEWSRFARQYRED